MLLLHPTEGISDINEGLFSWAAGLFRRGNIKNALRKYKEELPNAMKERLTKEFDAELAQKAGQDTTNIKEQIDILKQKETAIKNELNSAITEVLGKSPELKNGLAKLRATAEKELLEQLKNTLEEFRVDDKYKESEAIVKKLDLINKQESQLTAKIEALKDVVVPDENAPAEGDNESISIKIDDVIDYKTKDGKDVKIKITNEIPDEGTGFYTGIVEGGDGNEVKIDPKQIIKSNTEDKPAEQTTELENTETV
jgi:hypothetical protein